MIFTPELILIWLPLMLLVLSILQKLKLLGPRVLIPLLKFGLAPLKADELFTVRLFIDVAPRRLVLWDTVRLERMRLFAVTLEGRTIGPFSVEKVMTFVVMLEKMPWFAFEKMLLMPPDPVMRPVASKEPVMMSLDATMLEVLRILMLPVAVPYRFVAKILRALVMSLLFILTVEMAGSYAQSVRLERLAVVAIGTPFSRSSEPKPLPAVSRVLPI
jgi:hypothetical protein